MKTNILFKILLIIFFYSFNSYAQKVSNVTFVQEQSNIIISYDLESKMTCKISLFVSIDDGKTWQGPLKKVFGDAGAKIASGNHSITWNVLEEFEELYGDKIKFQVKAISDEIETVSIGNQVWMKKNLDVSTYRNGDIIPEVKNLADWENMKIGAWCYYNFDQKNGEIYGKLYNGYAILDSRGLAPEGYHIPFFRDLSKLVDFLGGKSLAGGKLKQKGISLWKSPNNNFSTDEYGFTAIPGGQIKVPEKNQTFFSHFEGIGESAMFWWNQEFSQHWCFKLTHDTPHIHGYMSNIYDGLSVRCIRD
jgi:uncharacterized protein (TIGR02145 family)